MKILTVTGAPRTGKDAFCESAFRNCDLTYPYSTIDEVKILAKRIGWDGKKDEKGRKFLSSLKDCLSEYNDLPAQCTIKHMKEMLEAVKESGLPTEDVVFLVQMREPDDIKRWKKDFGARALYIGRPGVKKNWGNHADDDVIFYDFDYQLINRSTLDDWEKKAVKFINRIKKETWESHI